MPRRKKRDEFEDDDYDERENDSEDYARKFCHAGAYKLAMKRIEDGTASNAMILHFLRESADEEKRSLEVEKLNSDIAYLKAKVQALESTTSSESDAAAAIRAFSGYSRGFHDHDNEDEDYDDYV